MAAIRPVFGELVSLLTVKKILTRTHARLAKYFVWTLVIKMIYGSVRVVIDTNQILR